MSSSATVDNESKTVLANITLTGHVLNTCCVKWSQDNCIAILVDKHIYVLSSRTDPTEVCHQFPYHKSLIPNPDKSMVFDSGFNVRTLLSDCSIDEQQILMCDPTLAGETHNSPTFRSYRRVDWSPICRQFGCLLAALTLDHRLVVYHKSGNRWQQMTDLSLLLNQSLKVLWTDVDSPNYQTYRDRMYSMATNAFCWAQNGCQNTDSISYRLYLGSKNGLITFWNLCVGSDLKANVEMVYKWETKFNQINCLQSFDNFLIISSINGTVCVIFTEFLLDSSPNPLSLWSEEDNIYVNDFAVKPLDDNCFEIVFTKSDFIIICRFSTDTIDDNIQMNLKSCRSVIGLHKMPSTAICSIIDGKYLLTSLDGRLIEFDINEDLTINQSEVTIDSINFSGMSSHGIDGSSNGILSVLVQSLVPLHDHLTVKEPVQVIVFTNISFESLTNALNERLLSESVAQINSTFEDYFDYFDCVRSFLSNSLYSGSDTLLFNLMDRQNLIIDCNDLLKLRIIRFITRSYISNHSKPNNIIDTEVIKRLESNAKLCEDLILKLFVEEIYKRVIHLQTLTESQLLSLKNINIWHTKRFSQKLVADNSLNFHIVQELCPICDHPIAFETKSYGQCSQRHRFNRCVNSLVLCDFAKHKFEKCLRCGKSVVISPSIWCQSSICLYCG